MVLYIPTLTLLFILLALFIRLHRITALEKIRPTLYKVHMYTDKKGNCVSAEKASYVVLLNNEKVPVRDFLCRGQTHVLIHTDGLHYLMYRESITYYLPEETLASLKITKSSIKTIILPALVLCVLICSHIIDNYGYEYERVSAIYKNKMVVYQDNLNEIDMSNYQDVVVYSLISNLVSKDTDIPSMQLNSTLFDLFNYYVNRGNIDITPLYSYNVINNHALSRMYYYSTECLETMFATVSGDITLDDAKTLLGNLERSATFEAYITYMLHSLIQVLKGYCIICLLTFAIRYLLYLIELCSVRRSIVKVDG